MSYPTTTKFTEAIKASHKVAYSLSVRQGGGEVSTLEGYTTGGTVTVQRTGSQRRCSLELVNEGAALTVTQATSLLSPLASTDILISRGVDYLDGTDPELIPLGLFRVARVEQTSESTLRVDGYDYGWIIANATLEGVYQIARGTNVATAIEDLLRNRYPLVSATFPVVTDTTPLVTLAEDADPWQAAQDLAESIGHILVFDPVGTAVLKPEPQSVSKDDPIWRFEPGDDNTLVEASSVLDVESVKNAVIAVGEGADTDSPPRAIAVDGDRDSPTYYYGSFGKRPERFSSPLIASATQARQVAYARLAKKLGLAAAVTVQAVPNPALDLLDVVGVTDADAGLSGNYLIEEITMPLDARSLMSLTLRAQALVVVQ